MCARAIVWMRDARRLPLLVVSAMLVWAGMQTAALAGEPDLMSISIEELMKINVTSVSKKAQQLADSAAAIFVITREDIRHSGVTTIPDALRMVPGLNVARIDANKWAVNSRGSTSRFSNKLLVLIDGRSVYNPYFSGVYWEVQDMLLDDIERIEVIRGPGATLWGANAVNGVINIISRNAADTQGGRIAVGGGNVEKVFAEARYGGRIGQNAHYRLYAKGYQRDSFDYASGSDANDGMRLHQAGFRFDTDLTPANRLTVQGDAYGGDIDQRLDLPTATAPFVDTVENEGSVSGRNLQANWQRILSSTSDLTLMAYYDHNRRKESWTDQERNTANFDFQHHFGVGRRHDIIWGVRYNRTCDTFGNTGVLTLDPISRTDELFSAFLQDEIALLPERVWLIIGSKVEHNDYTGVEYQPSARLFWSATNAHKLWTAVSRAVRTPSRVESDAWLFNDVILPSPQTYYLPVLLTVRGDRDFDAEVLMAYEAGYRFLPNADWSLDVAFFYNDYDDLRLPVAGDPIVHGFTHVEIPSVFTNGYAAQTYGGELSLAWQVCERLKLDLAYSYIDCNFEETMDLGKAPAHQVSLRSAAKLHADFDLDLWLRYVDDSTTVNVNSADYLYDIDGYVTLDMRLAWRPADGLELSIVGQNLLDAGHVEFVQEAYSRPTDVPLSIYGKISFNF